MWKPLLLESNVMATRVITLDDSLTLPPYVRVTADNLEPEYVRTVNGIGPDPSGNVEVAGGTGSAYKVVILNPDDPLPDSSTLPDGALIVRLTKASETPIPVSNVVILNPLDPEPDASSFTAGTLVVRLLEAN